MVVDFGRDEARLAEMRLGRGLKEARSGFARVLALSRLWCWDEGGVLSSVVAGSRGERWRLVVVGLRVDEREIL